MTNFNRVKSYYSAFNEWNRLDAPEGRLEFELTVSIITAYLPPNAEILDLGGGPGRYTIELAKMGYILHLADLSQTLLDDAKRRIDGLEAACNVKSIKQVNAVDLNGYESGSFDAVLLLGPLYHLTKEAERIQCVREVCRVLKPGGLAFAGFIPYLSGAAGVVDRMFCHPCQVSIETLNEVFESGIFNNNADNGFQEGYYPVSKELTALFNNNGFSKLLLRSVRGWGSGREELIYKLKDEEPEKFATVIELINKTADNPAIIETCSHALYCGQKNN